MAHALCMVVKQVFKFLLEFDFLIELVWQFETNLLKGFSFTKHVKIWQYCMPFLKFCLYIYP